MMKMMILIRINTSPPGTHAHTHTHTKDVYQHPGLYLQHTLHTTPIAIT